jgi:hypothetical protein
VSAIEQAVAALFFCGLLASLVWLLRKGKLASLGWPGASSPAAGQMGVIARRALTSQHTLHLVSAAGEMFLVVTYPRGAEIATFPLNRKPARLVADLEERRGQ